MVSGGAGMGPRAWALTSELLTTELHSILQLGEEGTASCAHWWVKAAGRPRPPGRAQVHLRGGHRGHGCKRQPQGPLGLLPTPKRGRVSPALAPIP